MSVIDSQKFESVCLTDLDLYVLMQMTTFEHVICYLVFVICKSYFVNVCSQFLTSLLGNLKL